MRVPVRIIVRPDGGQLPVGNRFFRLVELAGYLRIEAQFGGIAHAGIVQGRLFRIRRQSYGSETD